LICDMLCAAFGVRGCANEPADFWNDDHRAQEGDRSPLRAQLFSTLPENFQRVGLLRLKLCQNDSVAQVFSTIAP